jgi:hypothetical protein
VSTTSTTPERMVIAIDPHKASWTAAVVDASLQPVATIRVPVSRDGYRALRRFANRWPDPTWAIEGASGLGAPLTARLRTDGIDVVDVPAKLAARVRMLSTGHGRKNDDADAVSVAIAARSARRHPTQVSCQAATGFACSVLCGQAELSSHGWLCARHHQRRPRSLLARLRSAALWWSPAARRLS